MKGGDPRRHTSERIRRAYPDVGDRIEHARTGERGEILAIGPGGLHANVRVLWDSGMTGIAYLKDMEFVAS